MFNWYNIIVEQDGCLKQSGPWETTSNDAQVILADWQELYGTYATAIEVTPWQELNLPLAEVGL